MKEFCNPCNNLLFIKTSSISRPPKEEKVNTSNPRDISEKVDVTIIIRDTDFHLQQNVTSSLCNCDYNNISLSTMKRFLCNFSSVAERQYHSLLKNSTPLSIHFLYRYYDHTPSSIVFLFCCDLYEETDQSVLWYMRGR